MPNPTLTPTTLLERAASACEQLGTAEGQALAAELRAQSIAPALDHGHRDFIVCQQLLDWNRSQTTPPIAVGSEYLVGMEAFRLSHETGDGIAPPVLVQMAEEVYRVLPRELPEEMLQALAMVSSWAPSDETGEDSDRTAVLEGWEAMVALAPEVALSLDKQTG